MMLLECPNCGPRNASEFRYGGEVQARPTPEQSDRTRWTVYLYLRRNPMGVLREWWYHRAGCGRWFIAERHTKSHDVGATYFWSEA
ncbi:MAG: sarcosine oxidase subunit delta [Anaerolineae bacterium]|nr:MAG: sarcosine oxidase subunit delta [Anaerolineae bacterium]